MEYAIAATVQMKNTHIKYVKIIVGKLGKRRVGYKRRKTRDEGLAWSRSKN